MIHDETLSDTNRLRKLESDFGELREDLKANTELTKKVEGDVTELLQAFQAVQGFWKVLEFIGKAAKPLAWIAGLGTLGTMWYNDFLKIFK